MKLFLTAFIQVALVSANTYFLAKFNLIGVAICGFGISWLWTTNVRKVSIGSVKDRVIYSSGACLGGLTGVVISKLIMG